MVGIALAAVVFIAAMALAVTRWQRRDESALFVLRLLPAALLFAVAPVLSGTMAILRGFSQIAAAQQGGLPDVAGFVGGAVESLLAGTMLFVMAAAACVALEAFAADLAQSATDTTDTPLPAPDAVERCLLVGSAATIAPVILLWMFARGTATRIFRVGLSLTPGSGNAPVPPEAVEAMSSTLSARILAGLLMGGVVSALLLLLAVALALYPRRAAASRRLTALSRIVAAVGVALGLTGAALLFGDLRAIEEALR